MVAEARLQRAAAEGLGVAGLPVAQEAGKEIRDWLGSPWRVRKPASPFQIKSTRR